MKTIIEGVINNRKITIFIVIFIFLSGVLNYSYLPKQENPDVSSPFAIITCVYPGASPEDVEELVTSKIEDEIFEIEGYDYSSSSSMDSLSVVWLILEVDTDLDEAFGELREKMDDIQSQLPDECEKILIKDDIFKTTGFLLSISGENFDYSNIGDFAEIIQDRITKINGIQKVEMIGDLKEDVIIEVDENLINYYGFSLDEIVSILKLQNTEIPSGKIGKGNNRINVKTKGTFESVDEIGKVILDVSDEDGSIVRIKDIANIYYELDDSVSKINHNGENAVLLAGYFKENKNIVTIGKDVRNTINSIKNELPDNLKVEEVIYQPKTVNNSVNNFIKNLLQGIVFVIIVVFIGMGFRNALVVSFAIPFSIVITFIIMKVTGYSIHQLSISGLIISLGMLVDNAIVVSDSIQVRIDNGQEKIDAAVNGVKEVAVPVLTSTLTTVAVFIPLMMINSVAGEFIRSIPMVVVTALSSSYLIALLVIPVLAYIFFKPSLSKNKSGSIFKTMFLQSLRYGLKNKLAILSFVIIAVIGGYMLAENLGLQFFPKADTDIFYINISNDSDGDLNSTEDIVNRVAEILLENDEVVSYTASMGDGLPKFYYTMMPSSPSKKYAQMLVKADLDKPGRFESNTEFIDYLQGNMDRSITNGKVTVKELEQGEPVGAPVTLRLTGENIDDLANASEKIKEVLEGIDGTYNIFDNLDTFVNEYYVDVDVDRASVFGISKFDVQNEVSIALRGREATIYRKDGSEYSVRVETGIDSIEELENFAIKSSFIDNKILLKEIANINLIPKIPSINKYNREKQVTILSSVKDGFNSIEIQDELKNKLENINLKGVNYEFDGEEQEINEEFGGVGIMAIFALCIIYFILMIQFKSFLQPVVIFASIPLSAIGSVIGLWIFKQPLSFTGLLGIVSLFGIVVNNAIVLIDYINSIRKGGLPVNKACIEAVDKRFRPITLSTITTLMGLIPLVLSNTELFTPMAISLMSGLFISTLLTLIIVPVFYSWVVQIIEKISNLN